MRIKVWQKAGYLFGSFLFSASPILAERVVVPDEVQAVISATVRNLVETHIVSRSEKS